MKAAIGRLEFGRYGEAGVSQRAIRWMCLLAAAGVCLVLAPAAAASLPSFTWDGGSTAEEWEAKENWVGGIAPTNGEEIGALTFPRLTSPACEAEQESEACYFSFNDVRGLSAESLDIDDGDEYVIHGNEITLGSGGLTASPASGTSGPAGDIFEMPFQLDASQTWSISGRGDSEFAANNLLLAGNLTGPGNALTFEIGDGPGLYLAKNDTEVGPVRIDGTNTDEPGVLNGFATLLDADLNSSDGEAVSLSHILVLGSGSVGPLATTAAELAVGTGSYPAKGIEAASVKLDPASAITFEISHAGVTAQQDYSQVISRGSVELGDASIEVVVRPPKEGEACPVLTPGQTFTFVSTTGTLSGSFANAGEDGPEIPLRFATRCSQISQKVRISYHESGGVETVTGTVEAEAAKRKEEEVKRQHEEELLRQEEAKKQHEQEIQNEEALKKLLGEHAKQVGEEAAAGEATAKKHEEEATAAKKHEEEEAAAAVAKEHQEEASKGGVLGVIEGSPDATIAGTSLQASTAGAVSIAISCPIAASSCSGTVTLRTLTAVAASLAGAAKSKGSILTLAIGSFTVVGGKITTVKLHLSAKARALLARLHVLRARATVVAHDPAGASHTSQIVVTLRAASARRDKA